MGQHQTHSEHVKRLKEIQEGSLPAAITATCSYIGNYGPVDIGIPSNNETGNHVKFKTQKEIEEAWAAERAVAGLRAIINQVVPAEQLKSEGIDGGKLQIVGNFGHETPTGIGALQRYLGVKTDGSVGHQVMTAALAHISPETLGTLSNECHEFLPKNHTRSPN